MTDRRWNLHYTDGHHERGVTTDQFLNAVVGRADTVVLLYDVDSGRWTAECGGEETVAWAIEAADIEEGL